MRQPDGTFRRPPGSQGSALQLPVQAPQGSRLSTESTSATAHNGTLEICTCTGSTDRDEPPTGRHCTAMEEMTRHRDTRTSRMQTPARPDGRQGAQLDFFKLKKRRGNGFCEADQLFRLSLSEESTICFAFSALTCQVPGKILKSTARKPSLSLPTPGTEHPGLALTPPTGAQRTLNFTGISFKGTKSYDHG